MLLGFAAIAYGRDYSEKLKVSDKFYDMDECHNLKAVTIEEAKANLNGDDEDITNGMCYCLIQYVKSKEFDDAN